jgi:hypothetical protein
VCFAPLPSVDQGSAIAVLRADTPRSSNASIAMW